jgi:O-antigen/teichoic acid export membrane protein
MKRFTEKMLAFLEKLNPEIFRKIKTSMTSRLGQGFSWNMLSLVILAANGFLMNALIVATRGEEALGVFNQVYAIYLIFSQVVVFGLHHSVLRLVSMNEKDRDYCSEITISALILIALISIPATILSMLLIKPISGFLDSPDVIAGLFYTLPSLFFFSINKVLINVLNGLDEMKTFSFFRSLRYILLPVIILIIIVLKLDSRYISLSLSICEFILSIWLFVFIFPKVLPFTRQTHFKELSKEHLSFGYRGFLSGLLIGINTKIDVLMIGSFMTDTHVASTVSRPAWRKDYTKSP